MISLLIISKTTAEDTGAIRNRFGPFSKGSEALKEAEEAVSKMIHRWKDAEPHTLFEVEEELS